MSMCAPRYYNDPEFKKWYDFKRDRFKKGAPQKVIDMKKNEDEARKKAYEEALKKGICL